MEQLRITKQVTWGWEQPLLVRKEAKCEVAGSMPAAWAIAKTHIFIDLLAKMILILN